MKLTTLSYRGISSLMLTFLLFLMNTMAQDAGFFLDEWVEKTAEISEFQSADKPVSAPTVTVDIDMSQEIAKVPHYIYGNNAITWDNGLRSNATAMTDLKNLQPRVLRWPAGSGSNSYFWNAPYKVKPDDIPADVSPWYGMDTESWQMGLDEYYDLREKTNSQGSICVNYSYARYGLSENPVAKAAHLAADWVRYDNGRTKFWEIGNENYGNWEHGNSINTETNQDGQPEKISGQLYGQHCKVFIDSMRAAASEIGAEIKIGVVVYDSENSWDPISEVWNEGVMPEVGDLADFLAVHSYFTPYNENSGIYTVLNSHNVTDDIMGVLVADMAEAGKPMIPVAMTEWNIFAQGSMQAVSFINGMHAALLLGEFVQNGYGSANRWDLVNNWNNGDDHAMFSSGGEPGVDAYNPRPAFFYMYYFQKYFGDRMVESSVTGSNSVVSYASSFSSGECGTVLINKSKTGQTVELNIDNFDPGARYYTMTLTGGTDNGDYSRKVLLNGVETDEQGGGPDEYETIKALASDTEGGIIVDLPSLGVVYILSDNKPLVYTSSKLESDPKVIDVEFSDEVIFTEAPTGYVVNVNWSGSRTISTIEIDPVDAHWIHITLEEAVLPTDDVTISYSGSEIESVDGEVLQPIISELVENLLEGSPPKLKEAETNIEGTEVHLFFSKDMAIAISQPEDFTLIARGDPDIEIPIAGVTLDPLNSKKAIIDVSDPLYMEYDLFISYEGTSLESFEAVALGSILSNPVLNNAPGSPPVVVLAETNVEGDQLTIQFSKVMEDLSGETANFTVVLAGVAAPTSSLISSGSDLSILLDDVILHGEEVTLAYTGTSAFSIDRGQLLVFTEFEVTNNVPVGVDQLMPHEPGILIYPNPASDQISISAGDAGILYIEIVDIMGKKVLHHACEGSHSDIVLPLQINKGLYLVKVSTGEEVQVSRLVIE
jgi:hypothetical protein